MKGWSANCMLSSMFIFYIPLLCSFHVYCAAKHSLKFGELITDNGETLVSAGGEFEVGFFTPNGSSGHKRYVGIWYTRGISKQLYGLPTKMTLLSMQLEHSGGQQMAPS